MGRNPNAANETWDLWEQISDGFKGSPEELEDLIDEMSDHPRIVRRKKLSAKDKDNDVKFRPEHD